MGARVGSVNCEALHGLVQSGPKTPYQMDRAAAQFAAGIGWKRLPAVTREARKIANTVIPLYAFQAPKGGIIVAAFPNYARGAAVIVANGDERVDWKLGLGRHVHEVETRLAFGVLQED